MIYSSDCFPCLPVYIVIDWRISPRLLGISDANLVFRAIRLFFKDILMVAASSLFPCLFRSANTIIPVVFRWLGRCSWFGLLVFLHLVSAPRVRDAGVFGVHRWCSAPVILFLQPNLSSDTLEVWSAELWSEHGLSGRFSYILISISGRVRDQVSNLHVPVILPLVASRGCLFERRITEIHWCLKATLCIRCALDLKS